MKRICNLSTFSYLLIYFVLIFTNSCDKTKLFPVLTTSICTDITQNTASCGGEISSDGGSDVKARGTCWSLSPNPTIADNKTTDAAGTGKFTSSITGLIADTTYYVRAYATNDNGTAYGIQVTFKTLKSILPKLTTTTASDITDITATCGGMIIFNGGTPITVRGICWSTTQNPTTANNKIVDISGLDIFTILLTKLTNSTTYYARAFATNSTGTGYGNQVSFKTNSIPTLTTTSATAITLTTAMSGGNITSDGGTPVIFCGVCWSTSQNPTIQDNKTSNFTLSGTFTSSITGLNSNTTYYLRSYATNKIGTAYGNQLSFRTTSIPNISTTSVSVITLTTAKSGGNVSDDGGATVSERGLCWSKTQNPTTQDSKISNGSGTGTFSNTITGLESGTIYYIRAYAINIVGTAYGNQISFTTVFPSTPTVNTNSISLITNTTASCGGEVSADGGASVTERGICWSTTINPTINDKKTVDGNGMGVYLSSITGLNMGTTYFVRAYATNRAGTGYGNNISFTTNGIVTDIDGNVYHTITIGTQIWMVENLKTTRFNNGSAIPRAETDSEWSRLNSSGFCGYNSYGELYNWYAVNTGILCPIGWHVPSNSEWTILENFLGTNSAGKLKEKGTSHWSSPNTGATNETGFTALPGNFRNALGSFGTEGFYCNFWSSTLKYFEDAWYRTISYNQSEITISDGNTRFGLSVRCIKN